MSDSQIEQAEKVYVAMSGRCAVCDGEIEEFLKEGTVRCFGCWVKLIEDQMLSPSSFLLKSKLAKPARYYGGTGAIHGNGSLDVETCGDNVVAVWFRCQPLPFRQSDVAHNRAVEMKRCYQGMKNAAICGVELIDG